MEVIPPPRYQNQEANNNLFKERAEYNKRLSDLEKTLEDLRQESGHMKNLIKSNKKAILEEVNQKITEGNTHLTKTIGETTTKALKEVTEKQELSIVQQKITNTQMQN